MKGIGMVVLFVARTVGGRILVLLCRESSVSGFSAKHLPGWGLMLLLFFGRSLSTGKAKTSHLSHAEQAFERQTQSSCKLYLNRRTRSDISRCSGSLQITAVAFLDVHAEPEPSAWPRNMTLTEGVASR